MLQLYKLKCNWLLNRKYLKLLASTDNCNQFISWLSCKAAMANIHLYFCWVCRVCRFPLSIQIHIIPQHLLLIYITISSTRRIAWGWHRNNNRFLIHLFWYRICDVTFTLFEPWLHLQSKYHELFPATLCMYYELAVT